jgi:hypothetical protein
MVGRLVLETLPAVADDPADVASVMAVVRKLADDPGECHKNSPSSFVLVFLMVVAFSYFSPSFFSLHFFCSCLQFPVSVFFS